jgi:hypothetical protein
MSSQCKGTTKSGTQCKVTIVLPNGYCRIHQDQYIVEKKEDTKEVEIEYQKIENEEEMKKNIAAISRNSTSYVRYSNSANRWYIVPIVVMAFFWIISRLMKKKK